MDPIKDEITQAEKFKWITKLSEDKKHLEIEVNADLTYEGSLEILPGMKVEKLIEKINKGEIDVLIKTADKMELEIGFMVTTLLSSSTKKLMNINQQLEKASSSISELEIENRKLSAKCTYLEKQYDLLASENQKLKNETASIYKWEEEDLNLTTAFDINCIYKLNFTNTHSMTSVAVNASTLYFCYSGANYTTVNTNRRANSTGWVVNKIMKMKV